MSLGTKFERCKWDQTKPQEGQAEVNAFNDFLENCLILEPYFLWKPLSFDSELPKFWNYAIQSTLGHELGHGFDVWGTKMDAKGIY